VNAIDGLAGVIRKGFIPEHQRIKMRRFPRRSVMTAPPTRPKDPRRVEMGRLSRMKRRGLTPEGREKLRQSTLAFRPWRFSTGPRTAAGKAKVSENGKRRQKGPLSLPVIRAELAEYRALMKGMREARAVVAGTIRQQA
jgi:hypothetical protein